MKHERYLTTSTALGEDLDKIHATKVSDLSKAIPPLGAFNDEQQEPQLRNLPPTVKVFSP